MDSVAKILGQRIAAMRNERGMSQDDLVVATGLTQKAISEIENGHRQPRRKTLDLIAKALGVSALDLYKEPEPEKGISHLIPDEKIYQAVKIAMREEWNQRPIDLNPKQEAMQRQIDNLRIQNQELTTMLNELPEEVISLWADVPAPIKRVFLVFLSGDMKYLEGNEGIDKKSIAACRQLFGLRKISK